MINKVHDQNNVHNKKIVDYNLNTNAACSPQTADSKGCGHTGFTRMGLFSGDKNCCGPESAYFGNIRDSNNLRPVITNDKCKLPSQTLPFATMPYVARGQNFARIVPVNSEVIRSVNTREKKAVKTVTQHDISGYNYTDLHGHKFNLPSQTVVQSHGVSTRAERRSANIKK